MTMVPFNGDQLQALKWMQNQAPNIQSLIKQKANWYDQNQEQFWSNWERDVFNINTATNFGLMVWCIILGVPASFFGFYASQDIWGFGPNRQNFKYIDEGQGAVTNPNLTGGNFYGGTGSELSNPEEIRKALKLRYVALVSNGSIYFLNRMLREIFNNGEEWDFAGKKYVYVADQTINLVLAAGVTIFKNDWSGNHQLFSSVRTNYLLQSQLMTGWARTNTVGTTENILAPDGSTGVLKLLENTTTTATAFSVQLTTAFPDDSVAVFSVYVKKYGTNPRLCAIRVLRGSSSFNSFFDVVSGTVISRSPAGVTTEVTALANDWYRISIGGLSIIGSGNVTATIFTADVSTTANHIGDNTTGLYLWGAQLEALRSLPTELIQTTTASLSRTDFVLNTTIGTVTMAVAPASGAALTWSGTWGTGTAVNQNFGYGNGSNITFTLSKPTDRFVDRVANAFTIEYRFGANIGLSAQFYNMLNDRSSGVLPTSAGCKVTAIKET